MHINFTHKLIFTLFAVIVTTIMPSYAEYCGRWDIGPAYARIDVLESGHTVKTVNMGAIRTDATIIPSKEWGFCIKPCFLYGKGHHGELITGGAAVGFCCPFRDCFYFTPLVGCTLTQFKTKIDVPVPVMDMIVTLEDVKERFRSVSPYIGLEITYSFWDCWRICGMYQYAWSRTHTTLKHLLKSKSKACGPNYSLMIERDINKNWSVNIGAAYNISLTKEKHGLRGMGVKLGVAYWW